MSEKVDDLVKILIKFSLRKSKTEVEDYFNSRVYPQIITKINEVVGTDVTNLNTKTKLEVTDVGRGVFMVYPRIFIKGDTNLTRVERKIDIDRLIDYFNTILQNAITTVGGRVITTHLCYRNKESVTRWA